MKITVIGGGSWATAIVKILSENADAKIKWWMRNHDAVEHIRQHRHNPKYLSSIEFHPSRVKPYFNLKDALKNTEWVILAVPAAFLKDALVNTKKGELAGKYFVSAIKGMIPETNEVVSDFLLHNYDIALSNQCVIAGPCHAEEVALEKQSYLTIAAPDPNLGKRLAEILSCRYVNTSYNQDLYGVELSAVIKNIVALACGITHGIGVGDNFQAVMVSNAMLEIKRFVNAAAPFERELISSAYLGDLLVTAYSQFSRNRAFGNMIGRGYGIKAAQMEMNMIAEGYYAVKSIYEINRKLNVKMPIVDFTYAVLYQKNSLKKEFNSLKAKLS